MLVSLYYKRANRYGAIAGILGGGITSAIWQFFNITLNGQAINPIAPGFLISLILIFLVSRITKK
jgi:sodium/proline symporter